MTERRFAEYQPQADTTSLKRFDMNLRHLTNAGDLSGAFQSYIEDEFELTDSQAATSIVNELRSLAIIPSYDADTDTQDALLGVTESYRLAIFKAIMPLYQASRSTNELGGWLPFALETIVPSDSRHSKDICDYIGDDTTCAYGQCPIKVIYQDVEQLLVQPDFDQYGYICDHQKAYRTTNLLFEHAVKLGFITVDNEKRLAHSYQAAYSKYFAVNR